MVTETGVPGVARDHAVADGDARAVAFRLLADRHLADAYRLATAVLNSAIDAEDATQDAFIAAWKSWHTLRDPAAFRPWFNRILLNTCRNRLRSRRPVVDISGELDVASADLGIASEDRDEIERALTRLSDDHRIVVALRFYGDWTVDDIARHLAIPPGTVKSRLHHALARLARFLDSSEGTRR
jgi:RNA polymerase sigma-70 factor (ECF subfamily)